MLNQLAETQKEKQNKIHLGEESYTQLQKQNMLSLLVQKDSNGTEKLLDLESIEKELHTSIIKVLSHGNSKGTDFSAFRSVDLMEKIESTILDCVKKINERERRDPQS